MTVSRRGSLALALALAVAPGAAAQTLYGTLVGNVTDPSDAAVAAAKVAAVNTGTGFSREAVSDDRGGYLFSDLQPGAYRVTVTAAGFSTFTQTDVQVSTNAVLRVDVHLQLQTATESVTVAAAATTLQSDRSDLRAEISGREYRDLPVPGARNYQALFKLVPGFTPPRRQRRHQCQHEIRHEPVPRRRIQLPPEQRHQSQERIFYGR